MDLPTILSVLAVVAAIGFPLLARRDMLTTLEERDRTREEWKGEINTKLDRLTEASLNYRIQFLETQHHEYKDWKHEKADPYINDYQALERRVQRIERYLNGKLNP
jgi:hypothetical protein